MPPFGPGGWSLAGAGSACTAGMLAGLLALGVDFYLASVTLTYSPVLRTDYLAWYVGCGAVVAGGLTLLGTVSRRAGLFRSHLFACTVATLYAVAIVERFYYTFSWRAGLLGGIGACGVALALYAGSAALFFRLSGRKFVSASLLICALMTATALAVNRNVTPDPTSLPALAADLLLFLTAAGTAWSLRRVQFRWLLGGLVAVAGLWIAGRSVIGPQPVGALDPPATDRPNLILVIVDTLRYDTFRSVVDSTAEGQAFSQALGPAAWFSNAVAGSPWTAPSVASIMTGLYPSEHGFGSRKEENPSLLLVPLSEKVTCLAEHLQAQGYQTAAVVTNPILTADLGIAQGFEAFYHFRDTVTKLPLLAALNWFGWLQADVYQGADRVGKHLEGVIRRRDTSRPLFLWLHLMDPHVPMRRHPELPTEPATEGLTHRDRIYRDEVRFALAHLAEMFGEMTASGWLKNAAVVVVSDHGEMLLTDDRFRRRDSVKPVLRRRGHGHALYDELMRVPLVISPPGGLPEDRDVDVLTSHVDLAATVTELLGVPPLEGVEGRVSLVPWLRPSSARAKGGHPSRKSALISGTMPEVGAQIGLRTPHLKLITYPEASRPQELYRLTRDPGERRNLASRSRRIAERMRLELETLLSGLREPPESEETSNEQAIQERLRALGYL